MFSFWRHRPDRHTHDPKPVVTRSHPHLEEGGGAHSSSLAFEGKAVKPAVQSRGHETGALLVPL